MILQSIVNEEPTGTSTNYLCENPHDPTGSGLMHVSFTTAEPPASCYRGHDLPRFHAVTIYPDSTTRFTPKQCRMIVAYNHIHVYVPAGDPLVWARVGEKFRITPFTRENHQQLRAKGRAA